MCDPCLVFVIDTLEQGGAEAQLVMLVSELHRRGYRCEVFALRAEGPLREVLESRGIPVVDGGFEKTRDRVALLRGVCSLWRVIRRHKGRPSVVHAYLPLANFLGSIAARLAGASVVITSRRGLGKHQDAEWRWRYFDRLSNALSTYVSVNSDAVGTDIVRRDGAERKKIVCIRNGVDFSRFDRVTDVRAGRRSALGLHADTFAWVNVANLVDHKGHEDLLVALTLLAGVRRHHLFLIGRDRGHRHALEALVARLGISDRVTFLGHRDDIPELLCAMDAFVMASHTEGFSNSILESMAAGLPVVATKVGGNAEALENGALGVLVDPHDPKGLAQAMQDVMNNDSRRHALSAAAKQTARAKYEMSTMVDSYLNLYRTGLQS